MRAQNLAQCARDKAEFLAADIDTKVIATFPRVQMPVDIERALREPKSRIQNITRVGKPITRLAIKHREV